VQEDAEAMGSSARLARAVRGNCAAPIELQHAGRCPAWVERHLPPMGSPEFGRCVSPVDCCMLHVACRMFCFASSMLQFANWRSRFTTHSRTRARADASSVWPGPMVVR
jgi:hypothetical protein